MVSSEVTTELSPDLRAKALSLRRPLDPHELTGLELLQVQRRIGDVPTDPARGPHIDVEAREEIDQIELEFKEAARAQTASEASALAAKEAEDFIELKKKQHTAKVRAALTIAGATIGLWLTGDHAAATLVAGGGVVLDAIATYRDFHASATATTFRFFRNAAAAAGLLIALNGASGKPPEMKKTESAPPAGAPALVIEASTEPNGAKTFEQVPVGKIIPATPLESTKFEEVDVLGLNNSGSK